MKLLRLFSALLLCQWSWGQLTVTQLDSAAIPTDINYTGRLVQAVTWTDSTGKNVVVLSLTDELSSTTFDDEAYREKKLFATHYHVLEHGVKNNWTVKEFILECPVDIELHFLKNTFSVTDLDANGRAEVWLMYKASCKGDVSPTPMKIIMYEDNRKYAVRGTNRVDVGDGKHEGGEYKMDEAFKNAPAAFRKHAEKLWKDHKNDGWGE